MSSPYDYTKASGLWGRKTDEEIAHVVGCSRASVTRYRLANGIDASTRTTHVDDGETVRLREENAKLRAVCAYASGVLRAYGQFDGVKALAELLRSRSGIDKKEGE